MTFKCRLLPLVAAALVMVCPAGGWITMPSVGVTMPDMGVTIPNMPMPPVGKVFVSSPACKTRVVNVFKQLQPPLLGGEPYLMTDLGPCKKCFVRGVATIAVTDEVHILSNKLDPEEVWYKLTITFSLLDIDCQECGITIPIRGYVGGGFRAKWTAPTSTFLMRKPDARKSYVQVISSLVVGFNFEHIKLECNGTLEWHTPCQMAASSGAFNLCLLGVMQTLIPMETNKQLNKGEDSADEQEKINCIGSKLDCTCQDNPSAEEI